MTYLWTLQGEKYPCHTCSISTVKSFFFCDFQNAHLISLLADPVPQAVYGCGDGVIPAEATTVREKKEFL